jgi:serine/threonine-protein kinase
MIGRTLSHFRILAKLGEGGMGVVYRAEDEKLRRPVALKVLPPDLVGNEERRLRFLREARAAAAVSHPNIATIHEVGEADGIVFIAMELVEGPTLRSLIGGKPLPTRQALRIAVQVTEALAKAHQAHVIHRDLKPDNVVVGADGQVKLLDFGLAKLLEEERPGDDAQASRLATISGEMTREGKVLGTAAYMSPEQARGEPVDARSDIFSFGVTLYEMATGKAPFEGRTSLDVLSAIIQKEPVAPAAANPGIPPKLEEIIRKCLEKDAADRYQHAVDLVVDLRQLRKTTDSGVTVTAARKDRRAIWIAGGAAAAVALTLMIALALSNGGAWRGRLLGRAAPGRIGSLAVLPLANLSGDPEQEYFADGMTEELIASLGQIRDLRVISRQSVMRFKGSEKALPAIAAELGVEAVVEGSVMRSGERVRITAQLVEATADRHLWSESYQRDLRDVLALQNEVARAIAHEIRVTLTPQVEKRLASSRQVDPEAYQLYLQGRFQLNKVNVAGLKKSRDLFEKAIEKDPKYAQVYSGLADVLGSFPDAGIMPPGEILPRVKEAALESLRLDDSLAEGHVSLGWLLMTYEHDWSGAEREFKRAIELNPGYSRAHHLYARYFGWLGRHNEARVEIDKARSLDPLSLYILIVDGIVFYWARDYDAARRALETALDLEPGNIATREWLGAVDAVTGRYEEAIAHFQKGVEASEEVAYNLSHIGRVKALQGKKEEALDIAARVHDMSQSIYVPSYYLATIYTALGDHDKAIDLLERAYRERETAVPGLKVDPKWDPLRSDPRFQDLLRRVGLPLD